ncbi:Wzy polymerase domain-containing protein [Curvibacter sp. APW13]|uniref:PglL family O-oligosaccharyltransferase n=1 Tax=Curvibacter sp. APW13 TaxID=3077236 RepID=UPI0028DE78E8|nr:Wzy polymerase domain-containing protein [Curvibacter sp. APW13]MDT8992168.1 Wzy polymerase domain-containing protein [Curvibacter sp. APW13]
MLPGTRLGLLFAVIGLTSTWLVFPLVAGSLALLRDFWSWAVLCLVALWCSQQSKPRVRLEQSLAYSLLLAAWINAAQGLAQAYELWRHVGTGDVNGFLHQRNQFATLSLLGLAASAWILERHGNSGRHGRAWRTTVLIGALALGGVLSLSASRTGLLGLALLWLASECLGRGGAAGHSAPHNLRTALRWAMVGYGLALLPSLQVSLQGGLPSLGILARQTAQEGVQVCASRLSLWSNVIELIGQRPWTGWGWGELDYAHFVTPFHSTRFCELLSNAHNLPLHLAVELGLPATLLACAVAAWCIVRARPWNERHPTRLMAWSLLLAIGVHSMLEYPWWYGPFQVCALGAVWLLWRTRPSNERVGRSGPTPELRRTSVQVGMTALLGLVLLVAADYYRASQIYLPATQRLGAYRTATQAQIRSSVWFQDLIDFADLGLMEVTPDNAAQVHGLALKMLHFSPEAAVVEKLLDSAYLLGLLQEYEHYQQRFSAAYPQAFLAWKARQTAPNPPKK